MSEWKEVKLGDICTELSDGLHKAPLFVEGGDYIFVNAKNLCDGVIVDNDPTKKTTHEEYLKYSKPLNENTILFSIDGTIGNIARYKGEKCVLGKGACYINPNPVLVDSSYIYFQLQSPHFNSYLNCMSTGSTIKHISLKTMRNYEFTLPPLSEQRSIASILSALDDKIAVNRRICENLEAQAQALFKHWFIDFAPFKNGKFVESELGMIPEGWRVGRLDELGDIVGGATPSKAEDSYYTSKGIAWLTPKDLSNELSKFTSRGEIDLTQEGYNSCSAKLMPKGSVLFSSRAPIGYLTIAKNDICTNQGFKSVVPKYAGTAYIYYLLKTNTKRIESMSSGTTFKEASGSLMKSLAVIIPPKSIIDNYEASVVEIFNEQEVIEDESTRLSTLRDTLLPKLMSGQIKV